MAITRFIPQIWDAQLLSSLKTAHIFGQAGVVNRDYEGDIAEAGDTVRITSISRPSIGTYVPNSTVITPERLTDAQRTLSIDQANYFAFAVDDVDARQAAGNVMPEAMSEAAWGLADVVDKFIASFYTSVPVGNSVNGGSAVSVTTTTPTDFYDKILVPQKILLDQANIPTQGRWMIMPPWTEGRMLLDARFIRANEAGTDTGLRNGFIGRAAGFDLYTSNNAPLVTGDDYSVLSGISGAITFAEQISKVEAYRPESSFSDAVKGLHLWGAKVIRPEMLGFALVSQT